MSFRIHPSHQPAASRSFVALGAMTFVLGLLWWLPAPPGVAGIAHYLPLHTALETLSIVVAALIFAVGWHTPEERAPINIQLLACTFLGVAVLDFSHMLSYQGMPDFVTPSGPEKAINFWLAARLLAALGLLAAVSLPWLAPARLGRWLILGGIGVFVAAVHAVVLYHPQVLPRTFIPGQGLTPFKVGFEFVLVGLYLAAGLILLWKMRLRRSFNAAGLLGAAGFMALGELFFTFYADVTDIYNLAGHVYKVAAYALLYRAIFVETIRQPYHALQHSRSELANATRELADEHARLKNIIAGTQAGTWEWNVHTGQTLFNERWAEMLGYTLAELAPVSIETWMRLAHPDDLAQSNEALQRHFRGEIDHYDCEARMRHKAGHWIWVHARGVVLSWTATGQPEWMYGTHVDITERRLIETARAEQLKALQAHQAHLDQLANRDALTGLPNRRLLDKRLESAFAGARRSGHPLAVCMLDLDGLKPVNDTHGHACGDQILIQIAQRIAPLIRSEETLARLGGDEFVLIFCGGDHILAIERVLDAIREPISLNGTVAQLTASAGISVYRPGMTEEVQLLREADLALYQAKHAGRNRWAVFDPEAAEPAPVRPVSL